MVVQQVLHISHALSQSGLSKFSLIFAELDCCKHGDFRTEKLRDGSSSEIGSISWRNGFEDSDHLHRDLTELWIEKGWE